MGASKATLNRAIPAPPQNVALRAAIIAYGDRRADEAVAALFAGTVALTASVDAESEAAT